MLFNKSNWTSLSCSQYLNNQSVTVKTVVLRVDVDRSINKSLKMAKIFKKYNINATFSLGYILLITIFCLFSP